MSDEPIQFKFTSIQIISKSLTSIHADKSNVSFDFEIKIDTKVYAPNKLVLCHVNIVIKEKESSDIVASFVVACFFEVIDFDKHIKLQENGLYQVPDTLESIIRPVSLSTVRGVIYSELRGTFLQNTILPVLFMHNFKIEPYTDTSVGETALNK